MDEAAVERLAKRLADHRFEPASYEYEGTPDYSGEDWGRFVVLGVSVVWRLWPPAGERMWGVAESGQIVEDASGLWLCFGREPRSLDLEWLAGGGLGEDFFDGEGILQDVPRRIEVLGEVARSLITHHQGSVTGLVEKVEGDAVALRDALAATIPGYQDRPSSSDGVLAFDKLANLAVTMLAARLPITGTERFPVFPDYMLPRHLRHEGVLVYSDALARKVDSGHLLDAGSLEEMAIRWGTIQGAELLRRRLAEKGNPVSTPDLDYWLWSEAVLGPRADLMGPHHLCITEAY
ncbi:MAG: queuosine salvage family protein [Acidimicrobiia bacterium]